MKITPTIMAPDKKQSGCNMHKYCHWETFILCQNKLAEKVMKVLQFSWAAYTKPTPGSWKELLVLFLLCSCICMISSGLLYNWMFSSLKYGAFLCNMITCVFTGTTFLLLFLVHPMRCVFTMVIPTVSTKQGRNLLFSTCYMLVAINMIPNIIGNVKMFLQALHCITLTSAESLVNFTNIIREAKNVLDADITTQLDKMSKASVLTRMQAAWKFNSDTNQSAIETHLQIVGKEFQRNYFTMQTVLNEITLNTNRILAGIIFFYLPLTSARYLKCYLTDLEFDNLYITSSLRRLVQNSKGVAVPRRTSTKKLIRSTGWKMSSDEAAQCVKQMLVSTAYLALSIIVIAIDFIVFNLISHVLLWIADIPPVPIHLEFAYKVSMIYFHFGPTRVSLIKHQVDFPWNFNFVSDSCKFQPSAPDINIISTVCLLYAIACVTVFFETYALRVRRKISATFYAQREDERINYLHQKLLKNSELRFENKVAVFTVSEQCKVTFE